MKSEKFPKAEALMRRKRYDRPCVGVVCNAIAVQTTLLRKLGVTLAPSTSKRSSALLCWVLGGETHVVEHPTVIELGIKF